MRTTKPTDIEGVDEGEYLYRVATNELYTVIQLDFDRQDDGEPIGEACLDRVSDVEDTVTLDAADFEYEIHDKMLIPVPSRVINEPEDVLLEFATEELSNYLSRLSINHDFNGIDGIETLADICAAEAFVYRNTNPSADESVTSSQ